MLKTLTVHNSNVEFQGYVEIPESTLKKIVPREFQNLILFLKIKKVSLTDFYLYFVKPKSYKVFLNNIKKPKSFKNITEKEWTTYNEIYGDIARRFHGRTGIKIKLFLGEEAAFFSAEPIWITDILLDKRLEKLSSRGILFRRS